jgi:hypothetical protein
MKTTPILPLLLLTLSCAPAFGQEWQIPRTADGKPDLQGIWSNASQTPLQRPAEFGVRGSLNEQEAAELEDSWRNRIESANAPSDPDRAPPEDGNTDAGYNNFWIDRGTDVIQIGGEYRTSIVVDPPDGQIPMLEGNPQNDLRSIWRDMPGVGAYDAHELRPLAERCLLSFGSSSGPPMLPVMYNNNYQIVQTPGYVMILVEMVHDARIIRIDEDHYDTNFDRWMGDSVGHWEGDTLVVTTRNFHDQQSYRGSSDQLVVTERFELIEPDKIKYAFTMDDPLSFRREWTGEVAMNRRPTGDKMYEYACHEGNYAFPGIMGGARRVEVEGGTY